MTITEASSILTNLNYNIDIWFDFRDIPIILLGQGNKIYTDFNKKRIRINSTTELVEIVYGTYKKEDGKFYLRDGTELNETTIPDEYIDLELVHGFISSVQALPYGSFHTKPFYG